VAAKGVRNLNLEPEPEPANSLAGVSVAEARSRYLQAVNQVNLSGVRQQLADNATASNRRRSAEVLALQPQRTLPKSVSASAVAASAARKASPPVAGGGSSSSASSTSSCSSMPQGQQTSRLLSQRDIISPVQKTFQPGVYPQVSLTDNIPIYENLDGYPVLPRRRTSPAPPPPPPPYASQHRIVTSPSREIVARDSRALSKVSTPRATPTIGQQQLPRPILKNAHPPYIAPPVYENVEDVENVTAVAENEAVLLAQLLAQNRRLQEQQQQQQQLQLQLAADLASNQLYRDYVNLPAHPPPPYPGTSSSTSQKQQHVANGVTNRLSAPVQRQGVPTAGVTNQIQRSTPASSGISGLSSSANGVNGLSSPANGVNGLSSSVARMQIGESQQAPQPKTQSNGELILRSLSDNDLDVGSVLLPFNVTPPKASGPSEAEKKVEELTKQIEEQMEKEEASEYFGKRLVRQSRRRHEREKKSQVE